MIRKGQEGFISLLLGTIARELNKSTVTVIVDGRQVVIRIKMFPADFFFFFFFKENKSGRI